jgi:flavin reductase (DIM6/NTAB) family NADH-FMN oxidoreductase RutF
VQSELGPVLSGSRHTLGCRLAGSETVGFQMLVRGRVETFDLSADASEPLVRYRGRYRRLSPDSQAETRA